MTHSSIIYKNQHSYWHDFRNIRALLVAYYATFASTIYRGLQYSVYGKKGENSDTIKEQLQAVETPLPFSLVNTPIFNIQSTLNLILKQHSFKKRQIRPRPHVLLTRFAVVQKFKYWSFTIRVRIVAYFFVRNKMCDCHHYADDRTFYIYSKPCDLDSSADHINKAVTSLRDYSQNCNLALNSSKTNWMLISTPQMARYHSLQERKLPIASHL